MTRSSKTVSKPYLDAIGSLKRAGAPLLAGLVLAACAFEEQQAPGENGAAPLAGLAFESFSEGLPRTGLWVGRLAVLPEGLNNNGPPTLLSAPARKSGAPPAVFSLVSGEAWQKTPCSFPPQPYDYGPALAGDLTGDGQIEIALGGHLRGLTVLQPAHDDSACAWRILDKGLPTGVGAAPRLSVGALAVTADTGAPPWLWVLPDIPSARTDTRGLRAFSYIDGRWQRRILNDAIGYKTGAGLATGRWGGQQWLLLASRIVNDRQLLLVEGAGDWSLARIEGWPEFDRLFHDSAGSRRLRDDRQAPLLSYRYARDGQWYRRLVQLTPDDDGAWQQQVVSETATRTPFTALTGANLPGAAFDEDIVAASSEGEWHLFRQLRPIVFPDSANGFDRRIEPAPGWRRGCQAQGIESADLVGDAHDELIIHYATDPPAYDLTGPCPSHGGIEAWRIQTPPGSTDES